MSDPRRTPVPNHLRRIVLVGFMGSGKTTVGRLLADRLGWEFVDFDELVRQQTGMSIPELFREHGEGHFREIEGEVGIEALRRDHAVLAPGGGWPARPGRLEGLPDGTVAVWLRVTPEEAVRRAGRDSEIRPLLSVPDPLIRARDLLAQRKEWYRKAPFSVDTESAEPERVVQEILREIGAGSAA